MLNVHRLDPTRHAAFLAEQRKDPVTRKAFAAGDEIVVCAACGSAFSVDSWNFLGGEHDGQSDTLREITQEPVTLRGRRLRMTAATNTPPSENAAPPGPVAVGFPDRLGVLRPLLVVVLLGVLVWLVSLAVENRSSNPVPSETTYHPSSQSETSAAPSERELEETRLAVLAERTRVEQGLVGTWSMDSSRLTITREGNDFGAVYRFPDPGPFSRGEAHQRMRGELQADNALKLTNIHHGKLANPLDYFSGDFDGVSFVSLSSDGTSVTARLDDGRTIVLTRVSDEVPQADVTEPVGENQSSPDRPKLVELHTTSGEIRIRLFPTKAPNHVANFLALAQAGFYDGTKFHRVIPGFMIQGGDPFTISGKPSSWGTGGAAQTLKAEFNDVPHRRGIVSMARAQDRDSASSQFFICVADARFLDGQYTVFGEVVAGMDVVDRIVRARRGPSDRPLEPTTIERVIVRDVEDNGYVPQTDGFGDGRSAQLSDRAPRHPEPPRVASGEELGAGATRYESPPLKKRGAASQGPLRVAGDVRPPVLVTRVPPQYPEVARKARISGVVIVECIIDEQGNARDVRVLKSLPFGLDRAATDAVRRWRFRPATLNGEPVEVVFTLTVNFKLD